MHTSKSPSVPSDWESSASMIEERFHRRVLFSSRKARCPRDSESGVPSKYVR